MASNRTTRPKPGPALADRQTPAARMLAVLDLAAQLGMVSAADLMYQLDLPRPTAHRLIASLEALQLLQKLPVKGKYAVAPRMVRLATGLLRSTIVYAPMQTLLARLAEKTGETCSVAVMSKGELEYIASAIAHSPLTLQFQAGQRAPLHCTSSGRIFLAGLDDAELDKFLSTGPWQSADQAAVVEPAQLAEQVRRARKDGHALNDSGYIAGVVGAAVPIAHADGFVHAALTLSAPKSRKSLDDVRALLPLLKNYAARIARIL
jgi:DNA-binding IclR family transcriptional regulator